MVVSNTSPIAASLAPELARLRVANFYISRSLEQKLLVDAGELN